MRFLLVICLSIFSPALVAQNLVPNYSFEDISSCPTNFDDIYYAKPWFAAHRNGIGSSDAYNVCQGAMIGLQHAKHGKGFAGIYGMSAQFLGDGPALDTAYREYIETRLSERLKPGGRYCLSFYVSLYDNSTAAIKDIGALISTDPVYQDDFPLEKPPVAPADTYSYIPLKPQVSSSDFLADTLNWMEVKGTFLAKGGEFFITIGNFESTSHISYKSLKAVNSALAYYYIDMVSLVNCEVVCDHPPVTLPRDTLLCSDDKFTINFVPDDAFQYRWQDGSSSTSYTITSPGVYWLDMYSIDCRSRDSIVVAQPDYLNPFDHDTTSCYGTPIRLTVNTNRPVLWNTGLMSNTIEVDSTGLYSVEITGEGCKESDSIRVQFYDCVDVLPNVITPNGDGKNDYFVVDGINKDRWLFKVYNRWGMEVYSNENYDNSWNAQGLSTGVYYFYLLNQHNNKSYHGWVQVLLGGK